MKVYKKRLPEGVRKQFALEKGIKVKVLNSLYYDKKKKNTTKEKQCFFMKVFFTIKKTPKAGADFYLAGVERIELPSKVLETPMLPLYHAPTAKTLYHS